MYDVYIYPVPCNIHLYLHAWLNHNSTNIFKYSSSLQIVISFMLNHYYALYIRTSIAFLYYYLKLDMSYAIFQNAEN